jgi:hypothetical protein
MTGTVGSNPLHAALSGTAFRPWQNSGLKSKYHKQLQKCLYDRHSRK